MNDGFRARRWCACYDRAELVVGLVLDWLAVKLLILEPGYWDGVDFLVQKQTQMESFYERSTTAALQDLVSHVDVKSHS